MRSGLNMESNFVTVANIATACTTAMISIDAAVQIATGCLQASSQSLGETILTSPSGVVPPPDTEIHTEDVRTQRRIGGT